METRGRSRRKRTTLHTRKDDHGVEDRSGLVVYGLPHKESRMGRSALSEQQSLAFHGETAFPGHRLFGSCVNFSIGIAATRLDRDRSIHDEA